MQICHGILIPMLFFMFNELARKHVKTYFWEEWAPEWLHFLNPDRVYAAPWAAMALHFAGAAHRRGWMQCCAQ